MAALPYMPLYVADYIADTAHLTAVEHGAYLMLIMNYWQRGKALPADDVRLSRIARVDASEWPSVRAAISEFFDEVDGEWRHGRIEAELAHVHMKSVKAKAAAQRSVSVRSANAQRPFNHTDTDTDTEKNKNIPSPVGDGQDEPAEVPAQTTRQILFDEGLSILIGHKVPEKQARSLIGQWLRDSSDDESRVLNAIRLSRDRADAVAWIQAGFQTIRTKREKRRDTATELRDALADPLREIRDCEPVPHQPVRLVGFGG